ncbi:MAG: hypothetical protein LBL98_08035 [Ruminococcus sp.]|jgi:hypothetical protein|nr:hypothetical protein [Ruminococcus sp.]
MKKETLIKLAAERGVKLDESQADKYLELSDEDLENLEAAGGVCNFDTGYEEDEDIRRAGYCKIYAATAPGQVSCRTCSNKYRKGCEHPDAY